MGEEGEGEGWMRELERERSLEGGRRNRGMVTIRTGREGGKRKRCEREEDKEEWCMDG